MFEFKDVRYKDIIDIPSLVIKKGEITTLIGESGGGKTTILRLLNKMISPTHGEIMFDGKPLTRIHTITHRQQVTMLSQNPIVFDGNIKENLTAGFRFQEKPLPDDSLLKQVLDSIQLKKKLTDSTDRLSGGEKQRLTLGRVLLLDSPIYLLDEPSSALDDSTEELIIEMFYGFVKENHKTLVMVTHSKEIAYKYSDSMIRIENGRCVSEGE